MKQLIIIVLAIISSNTILSQENFVGDGFGGRSWYLPSNIEVGRYVSSAIVEGQLYLWGSGKIFYKGSMPGNAPFVNKNGGTTEYGKDIRRFVWPWAVPGFANTKNISISRQMSVIKSNGTGWVCSPPKNQAGADISRSSPFTNELVQVISNVKHTSAAFSHVVFVKNDGTVWSVGYNSYGAFGNGTTSDIPTNVPVKMNGITNAKRAIGLGWCIASNNLNYQGTLVLKGDGTVWLSGRATVLTPAGTNNIAIKVDGLSNIVDIKAGGAHAIALDKDGNVYSWGWNLEMSNGNGSPSQSDTYQYTPTKVIFPAGTPPMVMIESDDDLEYRSMSIDENKRVWSWGHGQTGRNYYNQSLGPERIAEHGIDINIQRDITYLIRDDSYPENARLWMVGGAGGSQKYQTPRVNLLDKTEGGTKTTYRPGYMFSPNIWFVTGGEGFGGVPILPPPPITEKAEGTLTCNSAILTGKMATGTPSDVVLKIKVDMTKIGKTPFTITGSGFTAAQNSVQTYNLGEQFVYISLKYDGSPLSSITFKLDGIGECTANIRAKTKIITTVFPLGDYCTPITPVTLSKM